jgi:U3 small nucleolar RNA-associated protein 11
MGLQRTFNRPRKSEVDAQLENDVTLTVEQHPKSKRELAAEHEIWKEQRKEQKKRARNQEGKQNLLDAVKQRESALTAADQELELQRAKMSNSVGGVNKSGVKFKIRERKR